MNLKALHHLIPIQWVSSIIQCQIYLLTILEYDPYSLMSMSFHKPLSLFTTFSPRSHELILYTDAKVNFLKCTQDPPHLVALLYQMP